MPNLDEVKFFKRRPFSAFVFLFLILADQLVKNYASNVFKNSNFAFSLPLPVWLMYIIYTAVFIGLVYYCAKNYRAFNFASKLAWTLIFAGAFSNIIERIMLGYVRDFIYLTLYKWTGIYNLADGFIILGIVILLFQSSGRSKRNKVYSNELGIRN